MKEAEEFVRKKAEKSDVSISGDTITLSRSSRASADTYVYRRNGAAWERLNPLSPAADFHAGDVDGL